MNRSKDFRRFQENKMKKKAKRVLKINSFGEITRDKDPKQVGRYAHVHCCPCSCNMCGNPRRHFIGKNRLTVEELKADITMKEQIE